MALVSYPEGRISRPMALRTRPSIVRSLPGIAWVPAVSFGTPSGVRPVCLNSCQGGLP